MYAPRFGTSRDSMASQGSAGTGWQDPAPGYSSYVSGYGEAGYGQPNYGQAVGYDPGYNEGYNKAYGQQYDDGFSGYNSSYSASWPVGENNYRDQQLKRARTQDTPYGGGYSGDQQGYYAQPNNMEYRSWGGGQGAYSPESQPSSKKTKLDVKVEGATGSDYNSKAKQAKPEEMKQATRGLARGGHGGNRTNWRQNAAIAAEEQPPNWNQIKSLLGNLGVNPKFAPPDYDAVGEADTYGSGYERGYARGSSTGLRGQRGRGQTRGQDRGRGQQYQGRGQRGQGRGQGRGQERGQQGQGQGRGRGTALNAGQFQQGVAIRGRGGFIRGRGRGGARGRGNPAGLVPGQQSARGVHSMAKLVDIDVKNMPVPEKLRRLSLILRNDVIKVNAVQTMENALTASKLLMRPEYTADHLMRHKGKSLFTGILGLCGVFLVRSVGKNKKDLKQDVFQKAIDLLKNKPVQLVMSQRDPGAEAIKEEIIRTDEANLAMEAKATQPAVPPTGLGGDLKSELVKVLAYLLSGVSLPENAVSSLEQCFMASHCRSAHRFLLCEDLDEFGGVIGYKGALSVANTILGEGKAKKKKDCKLATYTNALLLLKTMPIDKLIYGKSAYEFEQASMKQDGEKKVQIGNTQAKKDLAYDLPFEQRLERLVTAHLATLENHHGKEQQPNAMVTCLDSLSFQNGITPKCLYRKQSQEGEKWTIFCDLYFDDLFIASSSPCATKKEAQSSVYTEAWQCFSSTTAANIIERNRRLTKEDLAQPNVFDYVIKGKGKLNNNNWQRLEKLKIDPFIPPKPLSSFIVLEHEDFSLDRPKYAFGILIQSANKCGMLVQWDIKNENGQYHCMISIQKQVVAEAFGISKVLARSKAAYLTLCQLIENNHPLINTNRIDDTLIWLTWTELLKQCNELRKIANLPEVTEATFEATQSHVTREIDQYLITAATNHIREKLSQDVLDEVVFEPGLPYQEWKELFKGVVGDMNLKADNRLHCGKTYYALSRKYAPSSVKEFLQKAGGKCGRYVLVPNEQAKTLWNAEEAKKAFVSEVTFADMELGGE